MSEPTEVPLQILAVKYDGGEETLTLYPGDTWAIETDSDAGPALVVTLVEAQEVVVYPYAQVRRYSVLQDKGLPYAAAKARLQEALDAQIQASRRRG